MPINIKTKSVIKQKKNKHSVKHKQNRKQSGGARPAPTSATFEERLRQLQVSSLPSVPGTEKMIKFKFKNIENIPKQINLLIDAFQGLIKDEGFAFTEDIRFFYDTAGQNLEIRLILDKLSRVKLRSIDLINTIINNYCIQIPQKKSEFLITYASWICFFYDIIQYIDTTTNKIFNNQLAIDE